MARETEIVKAYPSDEAVREKIRVYEAFGWEVIGNEKRTDKVGSYEGADGNYYDKLETYVQLTFSREKSSPWYKKVAALEEEYYQAEASVGNVLAKEPVKPKYVTFFGVILCFTPLFFIAIPLLIVNIVKQSKAKKVYKKEYDAWLSAKYSTGDQAAAKKKSLLKKAKELVNA